MTDTETSTRAAGAMYVRQRDRLALTVEQTVRPAVREALDAGVPIAELARLFGTSRTSIRRWAAED